MPRLSDQNIAKQHALNVALKLGVKKGLIYLLGTPTVNLEDSDQPRHFRQRRYFYYLSGVNEPSCHLTYDIAQDLLTLYIPPINPSRVIWSGRGSTVAEAYEKYDVDSVRETTSLVTDVTGWMSKKKGMMYILHPSQVVVPGDDKRERVDSTKLQAAVDACRVIKDDHEIKLIRRANEISALAHRNVLEQIVNLKTESQVEAVFLETCVSEDAKEQSYEIIAASGQNGATLHYVKNDEPLANRQLMVLDAGAEWQNYSSDVTRTFPLNGKFTKEAQEIYDLVADMQEQCIKRLKPGLRFYELHLLAHKIAIEGLLKLGILHNGTAAEIKAAGTSLAFFPHGLGHHVGLEVHDVSAVPINAQTLSPSLQQYFSDYQACREPCRVESAGLEEGMVITIEPGLYFSQYALSTVYLKNPVHRKYINKDVLLRYIPVGGVRIEDNLLITAKGYENITTAPKGKQMLDIINNSKSVPRCGCPKSFTSNYPDWKSSDPLLREAGRDFDAVSSVEEASDSARGATPFMQTMDEEELQARQRPLPPPVPQKLPVLPPKPLAYRSSVPDFSSLGRGDNPSAKLPSRHLSVMQASKPARKEIHRSKSLMLPKSESRVPDILYYLTEQEQLQREEAARRRSRRLVRDFGARGVIPEE